jgi:hypothetical protein
MRVQSSGGRFGVAGVAPGYLFQREAANNVEPLRLIDWTLATHRRIGTWRHARAASFTKS